MSDNKLIIEDIAGKERIYQRLEVTNVTDEPLRFIPNSNAVSKENYHLEVRFRNGTFVSPADYLKFDGFEESNFSEEESPAIRDGWQATEPKKNAEDGSWSVYLLSTSEYRLPPESDPSEQEPLDFLFEYTTADGSLGGRVTRVELS